MHKTFTVPRRLGARVQASESLIQVIESIQKEGGVEGGGELTWDRDGEGARRGSRRRSRCRRGSASTEGEARGSTAHPPPPSSPWPPPSHAEDDDSTANQGRRRRRRR